MVEQLFGSKTRVKLLYLFYGNPNRSFYVREITRMIDEQINSVRRELSNLLSIGIITSDNTQNKLYYEVNQSFEHYAPLLQIFGGARTAETVKRVKAGVVPTDLQSLGNVELAVYTGQFTRDESTGVDFLLVGDINRTQLHKFVAELEQREGKEIRYTVFTPDEFAYRLQIHDRFVDAIHGAKKQVLLDKQHVLS